MFPKVGLNLYSKNSAGGRVIDVLLTSDGCYVETSDGCILAIRARASETTIETIPDPEP